METEAHPDWCTRTACTAYEMGRGDGDQFERWHRSDPLVVKTDDASVDLLIHKFAEVDGTDEHIEVAAMKLPIEQPWYLAEPIEGHTMLFRRDAAAGLNVAMAQLV